MDICKATQMAVQGSGGGGGDAEALGSGFNGTTDYLSRSTDLVGNADGKTFTFSCWVYDGKLEDINITLYWAGVDPENTFSISVTSTGRVYLIGRNSSSSIILNVLSPIGSVPDNTFSHILVSVDLSNSALCHIYINDRNAILTQNTYINEDINFTNQEARVGRRYEASPVEMKGRLSNLFLSYDYYDLSIESNRRLFTTYDPYLKPVDTLPAGAIINMPMSDPDALGHNDGTGGDFDSNGFPAQASRGANQFNTTACEFDGTDDYLSNVAVTGADTNTLTFAATIKRKSGQTGNIRLFVSIGYITINLGRDSLSIQLEDSGSVMLFNSADTIKTPEGVNTHIVMSVDLSNIAKCKYSIDGNIVPVTASTFVDGAIGYSSAASININAYNSDIVGAACNLGELYLTNEYIDLATDNPFWDSTTNKPKFIGTDGSLPTGSQPLIYMPMRADKPEENLGSGGNFTLNGGGLVGARGMSEYFARSIVVDASNYLTGSVLCASLVKWISADSGVTWTPTYTNSETVTNIGNGTNDGVVAYYWGTSDTLDWGIEANKDLVTDRLGFPRTPIDQNTVLSLMFEDSANFGFNGGSGADFTMTGAITSGADVTT